MEANKEILQKLKMLQFPFIVAFRDVDSETTNNSCELAKFLKCPLLNQNDITKAFLRNPSSKLVLSQNLAFEVVCEIALTQLSLKPKVVINSSSLSDDAHVQKLMKLATPQKAHLIIIQSKEDSFDGYGHGQVLKLNICKDSSFDVNNVVSQMSAWLSQKEKDDYEASEKQSQKKLPKNDHLHALNILEKPRKDNLACKKCSKLVLGPSYHCVECDEFTFHKSCAEQAPSVRFLSSQRCPSYLKPWKFDQYEFQLGTSKCNHCEEFSYDCYDCFFQTNLNHGIVPTILVYPEKHQHPLNFVIMPIRYDYQYLCCICNKLGYSISYKCFECYDCNFDAHLNCILPNTIDNYKGRHLHRFFLKSCSSGLNEARKNSCDICTKQIDDGQLFYECKDIDLNIHFRCMIDENHVNFMVKNKEEIASIRRYGYGRLSREELRTAFKKLDSNLANPYNWMKEFDRNGDGFKDLAELDDLVKYAFEIQHYVEICTFNCLLYHLCFNNSKRKLQ